MTFEIIDDFYGKIQDQGFATLSYFNVFEYGENICGDYPGMAPACNRSGYPTAPGSHKHPAPTQPPPSSTDPWANSTWFLLENVRVSLAAFCLKQPVLLCLNYLSVSQFPKSLVTSYYGAHGGFSSTQPGERKQIEVTQASVDVPFALRRAVLIDHSLLVHVDMAGGSGGGPGGLFAEGALPSAAGPEVCPDPELSRARRRPFRLELALQL